MKFKTAVMLLAFFQFANASDEKAMYETALKKIASANIKVLEVNPTPIASVKEVLVDGGRGSEILYISDDGKYIINGSIFDIENKVDITDQKKSVIRKDLMSSFGASQRIDFLPEKMEYHVTVFTDIDCGYCRKLHAEMAQYNELGIGISYLFFPRAGLQSGSFDKAVNVWCAADQQQAMTLAKAGEPVDPKKCDNPIAEHYKAGVTAGVSGTPALVLENGMLMPGYLPPLQLKQRLDSIKIN
ncbi:thioredoxin fold domain-containing protein [Marinicella litoralis]|uniref:Thiol:disulfide interchange protein n=1 Tax=Marinicella litoralis TaxID=644220 RepID=A0A4R6XRZ8_9GAMM|nr:thioredoxin fold domain-containing protein [Marinicella litoralis]TDR20794.1 thiol:disulfide interchange protein DsbC [Marinicella litoralis]